MFTPRIVVIWMLVFSFGLGPNAALYAEEEEETVKDVESSSAPKNPKFHYYLPEKDRLRERDYILPPLASLLVPGLDQWWEGQPYSALGYSAVGLGGILLWTSAADSEDNRYKDFAQQLYLTGGSLSMYHAFRTSVTTRRPIGEFLFLTRYETPPDLIRAPIRFDYMLRTTTWLPLLAGAVFFFGVSPKLDFEALTFSDFFYSGGLGYMTGLGEELIFRGYVMPLAMQYSQSENTAIGVSALAFAGAHGLRFHHFVSAFAFGLYAGWLSQRRDWTLSEVIFLHTWWDVMAFLADYSSHKDRAVLRIPTLRFTF